MTGSTQAVLYTSPGPIRMPPGSYLEPVEELPSDSDPEDYGDLGDIESASGLSNIEEEDEEDEEEEGGSLRERDPVFEKIKESLSKTQRSESVGSMLSSDSNDSEGPHVQISEQYTSLPYGIQPKATYEHSSLHADIMGVAYNGRMRQFVILDSKGITTWKRDLVDPRVRRALQYPKYEYCLIRHVVFVAKYNCYFALGKDFSVKVLNRDFEETCSVNTDMRSVLFILFNPVRDELITGGVGGIKIWNFVQAAGKAFTELKPLANYELRLKESLPNVGGSWVKRVDLDHQLQHLYCCSDTDLHVYDLSGKLLFKFERAHTMSITGCCFSPSAKVLITSSVDSEVKVWSLTGGLVHTFRGHSRAVTSLMLHPETSSIIMTSSLDGSIRMWSLDMMDLLYMIVVSADGVMWMGLTDDKLLYISTCRNITLWNLNTFYSFWALARSQVTSMSLTSAEEKTTRILAVGDDNSVRIFNRSNRKNMTTVLPPPDISPLQNVISLSYSREKNAAFLLVTNKEIWVYTTRTDPSCRIAVWNVHELQIPYISGDTTNLPPGVTIQPPSQSLSTHRATANGHGNEIISNCCSLCVLNSTAMMWTDEGLCCPLRHTYLLLGMEDGRILFMDPVIRGQKYMEFKASKDAIREMRHDPVHSSLVTLCRLKTLVQIQIWGLPQLDLLYELYCGPDVTCYQRVGLSLLTGHSSGQINYHMLEPAEDPGILKSKQEPSYETIVDEKKRPEHQAAVVAMDCLAALGLFVTCSADGAIKVWDEMKVLMTEVMLETSLSAACFLNDMGDLLVGFKNHIFYIDHVRLCPSVKPDEIQMETSDQESDVYEDPRVLYELIKDEDDAITLENYLVPYDLEFDKDFLEGKTKIEQPKTAAEAAAAEETESETETDISLAPSSIYLSPADSIESLSMIDLTLGADYSKYDLRDQMKTTLDLVSKANQPDKWKDLPPARRWLKLRRLQIANAKISKYVRKRKPQGKKKRKHVTIETFGQSDLEEKETEAEMEKFSLPTFGESPVGSPSITPPSGQGSPRSRRREGSEDESDEEGVPKQPRELPPEFVPVDPEQDSGNRSKQDTASSTTVSKVHKAFQPPSGSVDKHKYKHSLKHSTYFQSVSPYKLKNVKHTTAISGSLSIKVTKSKINEDKLSRKYGDDKVAPASKVKVTYQTSKQMKYLRDQKTTKKSTAQPQRKVIQEDPETKSINQVSVVNKPFPGHTHESIRNKPVYDSHNLPNSNVIEEKQVTGMKKDLPSANTDHNKSDFQNRWKALSKQVVPRVKVDLQKPKLSQSVQEVMKSFSVKQKFSYDKTHTETVNHKASDFRSANYSPQFGEIVSKSISSINARKNEVAKETMLSKATPGLRTTEKNLKNVQGQNGKLEKSVSEPKVIDSTTGNTETVSSETVKSSLKQSSEFALVLMKMAEEFSDEEVNEPEKDNETIVKANKLEQSVDERIVPDNDEKLDTFSDKDSGVTVSTKAGSQSSYDQVSLVSSDSGIDGRIKFDELEMTKGKPSEINLDSQKQNVVDVSFNVHNTNSMFYEIGEKRNFQSDDVGTELNNIESSGSNEHTISDAFKDGMFVNENDTKQEDKTQSDNDSTHKDSLIHDIITEEEEENNFDEEGTPASKIEKPKAIHGAEPEAETTGGSRRLKGVKVDVRGLMKKRRITSARAPSLTRRASTDHSHDEHDHDHGHDDHRDHKKKQIQPMDRHLQQKMDKNKLMNLPPNPPSMLSRKRSLSEHRKSLELNLLHRPDMRLQHELDPEKMPHIRTDGDPDIDQIQEAQWASEAGIHGEKLTLPPQRDKNQARLTDKLDPKAQRIRDKKFTLENKDTPGVGSSPTGEIESPFKDGEKNEGITKDTKEDKSKTSAAEKGQVAEEKVDREDDADFGSNLDTNQPETQMQRAKRLGLKVDAEKVFEAEKADKENGVPKILVQRTKLKVYIPQAERESTPSARSSYRGSPDSGVDDLQSLTAHLPHTPVIKVTQDVDKKPVGDEGQESGQSVTVLTDEERQSTLARPATSFTGLRRGQLEGEKLKSDRPHTAHVRFKAEDLQTAFEEAFKKYQNLPGTPQQVSADTLYRNDGINFEDNWQERAIERHTLLRMQKEIRAQSAAQRRQAIEMIKQDKNSSKLFTTRCHSAVPQGTSDHSSTPGYRRANTSLSVPISFGYGVNTAPPPTRDKPRPKTANPVLLRQQAIKSELSQEKAYRYKLNKSEPAPSRPSSSKSVSTVADFSPHWIDPRNPDAWRPKSSRSIPSKCNRYVLVNKPREKPPNPIPSPLEEQLLIERFPKMGARMVQTTPDLTPRIKKSYPLEYSPFVYHRYI